jgi:hypothetical protein
MKFMTAENAKHIACGVPGQAVVDAILGELGQVAKALAADMEDDLCKLINKHTHLSVPAPLRMQHATCLLCSAQPD